jgi:hypothetical protein
MIWRIEPNINPKPTNINQPPNPFNWVPEVEAAALLIEGWLSNGIA